MFQQLPHICPYHARISIYRSLLDTTFPYPSLAWFAPRPRPRLQRRAAPGTEGRRLRGGGAAAGREQRGPGDVF